MTFIMQGMEAPLYTKTNVSHSVYPPIQVKCGLQWIIKEININLFNFILDSKEKNIKLTIGIREIKHGGLNGPDIESVFMTLTSKWVETIC